MSEVDPRLGVQAAARRVTEWTERRDAAIRTARERGYSLRQIAEAANLSHGTVATITRTDPGATK